MALTKINASVIANNTIAVGNIADNSVDATKIASNSILTRHIDDDQVTGAQLADNIDIAGTLGVAGDLTVDTNTLFVDVSANKVGVGTTAPDLRLHVDGTNAYPATSGSTPTGMLTLRAKTGGASHGLFMGVGNASPYGSWLQAADADNLATEYPLLLNPNGGNVGIGTATNPLAKLEVTGSSDGNLTSAIFANSVQGGTNDTVSIELQLAGTSGQVAAGTLIAGKTEDWTSGTSKSGYLAIQAVLDGTNTEMARFGSTGDGTKAISFSNANVSIGHTSPSSMLHLFDGGTDTNIRIQSGATADNTSSITFDSRLADNSNKQAFLKAYRGNLYVTGDTDYGNLGVRTIQPSRRFEVQLTATNASMTDANSAVHFGSGSGNANTDGYIQGITLGYKSEGSNAYAKTGIVARGRNDGAARQDLCFLVDTAADGGSVQIADAKLTIDGITGDVEFNGGPVKGMRQVVQYQGATNATTISGNTNATFQSTTITTTGNSKLVVWAHSGQILKLQQNSNPWMRIKVTPSGGTGAFIGAAHEGNHYWYGVSSGSSQRLFLTEFGVSATLAAGTHTVSMIGGTYAADMIFNYQNQSGHMVIMEVGA